MWYVLIIYVWSAVSPNGGMGVATAEFNSLEACQAAAKVAYDKGPPTSHVNTACVEKGHNVQ